jgi:hypothetical protein
LKTSFQKRVKLQEKEDETEREREKKKTVSGKRLRRLVGMTSIL